MWGKWVLLAAGAAALSSGAAAQQTAQERRDVRARREADEAARGVAERWRPDYQPIGGRLGAFFLYPTLTLTAAATDNARASDRDRRGDAYFEAQAAARLQSNWSVHALSVDARLSRSVHARLSSEDATQYGAAVAGRLDASRDLEARLLLSADRLVEARSSYASPAGARAPVPYDVVRAAAGATRGFGRLEVAADLSAASARYRTVASRSGERLFQGYRDVDTAAADASAALELSPGRALLLRVAADRRRYALRASDPRQPGGLDRDSTGGRAEAGVKLSLAGLLHGQLRAGYLVRRYDDPRLRDASGASFGADLLWSAGRATSLRVAAERRVDEAGSTDVAGNRVTELAGTLDHEARRNLILTAHLRRARISPLGAVPPSSELTARAGALWLASRRVSLRAAATHAERTSPAEARRFRENRVTAGLALSF